MAVVYGCCFWFSLRLGGILIGLWSALKAIISISAIAVAQDRSDEVHDRIELWMQDVDLAFAKSIFESILYNFSGYLSVAIALCVIYLILCVIFVYGAFKCSTYLMMGFLVMEMLRLLVTSLVLLSSLIVLKKNTMDIGLLIAASVAVGFFMLAEFYLWVCTVNLPILIIQMERADHLETIEDLQRKLRERGQRLKYNTDIDAFVAPFSVEQALPDVYTKEMRRGYANLGHGSQNVLSHISGNRYTDQRVFLN